VVLEACPEADALKRCAKSSCKGKGAKVEWGVNLSYPMTAFTFRYTPRQPDPIPRGKVNVAWRQNRAGYVFTISGKDLLGVESHYSKAGAIEAVMNAGYCDEGGRIEALLEKIKSEN